MLDMFLRIYMCTGALFILSLLCMAIFIAFLLSTYLIIYLPTFLTIYAFRVLKVWPLRVTRIVLICPRCERRNFQTFNGFFYMFPAECILIIVARTTSEQWPQVPKCWREISAVALPETDKTQQLEPAKLSLEISSSSSSSAYSSSSLFSFFFYRHLTSLNDDAGKGLSRSTTATTTACCQARDAHDPSYPRRHEVFLTFVVT